MEFFNLPISSKVDKNIPKEIIYKNAEANEKFKRIFIESVEKITPTDQVCRGYFSMFQNTTINIRL